MLIEDEKHLILATKFTSEVLQLLVPFEDQAACEAVKFIGVLCVLQAGATI